MQPMTRHVEFIRENMEKRTFGNLKNKYTYVKYLHNSISDGSNLVCLNVHVSPFLHPTLRLKNLQTFSFILQICMTEKYFNCFNVQNIHISLEIRYNKSFYKSESQLFQTTLG